MKSDPNGSADVVIQQNQVAMQALRMRQSGLDVYDIAQRLNIPLSQTRKALKAAASAVVDLVDDAGRVELLTMEVSRLDQLQRAVWNDAMDGDTRAVAEAVKIIAQRAKLLGLEEATVDNRNQTIIVTGTSDEYIRSLKEVAARSVEVESG